MLPDCPPAGESLRPLAYQCSTQKMHADLLQVLAKSSAISSGTRYYGNCSSPVFPCEDIAAGPACPSPSKGVIVVNPQAALACAGSANQKTKWSKSARTRVVPTSVLTKASAMIASTLSDPMPAAFVVKSPIFSTDP